MMKAFNIKAMVAAIIFLLCCCFTATAQDVPLPYGQISQEPWTAKYYYALNTEAGPEANWYAVDFDELAWETIQGPLATLNNTHYHATVWPETNSTYWLRRHFTINDLEKDYYMPIIHDDGCEVYLNGQKIHENTGVENPTTIVKLTSSMKANLLEGDNVIAVKVTDTGGSAYIDFGLYEEEDELLTEALTIKGSLPITIENDITNPWSVVGGVAKSTNGNNRNSSSSLKFSFISPNEQAVVRFDRYATGSSSYHWLKIFVDNNLYTTVSSSDWTQLEFFVPQGNHTIELRDSIGNTTGTTYYSQIRNIGVYDNSPTGIANVLLAEGSLPMTFYNDENYPWAVVGNEMRNTRVGEKNSASYIYAKFKIDSPSMLTWTVRVDNNSYHKTQMFINDAIYYDMSTSGLTETVCLEPGEYKIAWGDSLGNTTTKYYSYLSNIILKDHKDFPEYVDVTISEPGQLGYESLRQMESSKELTSIRFLKVHGTMNEKDWTELAMMSGLFGVDLSDAKFDNIPANAFNKVGALSYLVLPNGVKTIGSQAFTNTRLLNLDIPSSVTFIGNEAFKDIRIEHVRFKEDSQLKTIGYQAFYNCYSLLEFNMPNTVTTLQLRNNYTDYDNYESNTFRLCSRLKSIVFSESLTYVPRDICYDCESLQSIVLPKKCTVIYPYAFCNNTSLKSISFNDKLNTIKKYAFCNTSRLQKISLPESLLTIYANAFENSGIDSLMIPIKVKQIYESAFKNCLNLKYIELPSNISSYDRTFYGCTKVNKIICKSATPPIITNDPFESASSKANITIYVPEFALPNYKLDSYWYQFGTKQTYDIILDYWRVAGNLVLGGSNRMGGKPDLDIYYGGKLTVAGNEPMPVKNLNLYVSESNPGALLNDCGQFTADSIVSVFSVAKNTWYFITPMHNVKKSEVSHSNASADFIFRHYDSVRRATNGTGSSWQNVVGDTLYAGQGYIYQCNQDGDLIMPAIKETQANVFNMAEVTRPLDTYASENAANANWNYIGNPYPCYYDIWYMDFTAPITIRNGSNYEAKTVTDDKYVLRPMQAFFVQKPADIDKIVFRHEGRQTSSTVNRTSAAPARTLTEKTRYLFNIEIADGEQKDQTRVVFNNAAKMDYEMERDASKFMSDDLLMPQIYSIDPQGNQLAINERPEMDGIVALGVYIGQYGTYTISATRADAPVSLYDSQTGVTVDLANESYTFSSSAADYQKRFYLNASGTTGIVSVNTDECGHAQGNNTYYNLAGQKVTRDFNGIVIKNGKKVIMQ